MHRWLLALTLLCWILPGCGGNRDPVQVVRQFHIAAMTDDEESLATLMDTSGVTTPRTDFTQMRDTLIFFAKRHPVRTTEGATKLVDAVCNMAVNPSYSGEGTEVLVVADLSRVLVPFLGDAARGVMGKPKDIVKYSFGLEQRGGGWVITRVTLPGEQLADIGTRFEIDLEAMNSDTTTTPETTD